MSGHWRDRARCAETDPDLWFPEKGHPVAAAKRICFACEVRDECLAYALAHPELLGVWGGFTEPQRRVLRLAREAA